MNIKYLVIIFILGTLCIGWYLWPCQAVIEKSPVGLWKTIDDKTGKAKSIVSINIFENEMRGKIVYLFPRPGRGPNPLCDKCDGDRKNKPIKGMTIIWGMKKYGNIWKGGHILDPENGKIYKCKIWLSENGEQLEVRGFIGLSLIGRTQTWVKVDKIPQ